MGERKWKFENRDGGKCDVRLNKHENEMLDHLAEVNGVTRSDVMRRALRDYAKWNGCQDEEDSEK